MCSFALITVTIFYFKLHTFFLMVYSIFFTILKLLREKTVFFVGQEYSKFPAKKELLCHVLVCKEKT